MSSITSANAVITFGVPLVLPVFVTLSGFSADDIFTNEDVDMAETIMGVDGKLSGGFVYAKVPWTVSFQADSASIATFEAWDAAQQAAADVFVAQANVTLTSVGASYQMLNGFLRRGKRMPDAAKTLMPRKFTIDWERVIAVPVGIGG